MANATAPAHRSRTDRLGVAKPLTLHRPKQETSCDRSAKDAEFHLAANVSGGLFEALRRRSDFKNRF